MQRHTLTSTQRKAFHRESNISDNFITDRITDSGCNRNKDEIDE